MWRMRKFCWGGIWMAWWISSVRCVSEWLKMMFQLATDISMNTIVYQRVQIEHWVSTRRSVAVGRQHFVTRKLQTVGIVVVAVASYRAFTSRFYSAIYDDVVVANELANNGAETKIIPVIQSTMHKERCIFYGP